ncbi:MAG: cation-transporting P-type ATPase [Anaeromyxobacter sp.]|nr:cation-transporting P-type ATPase [Anaeromyxobacter sp.]MBL0275619.1 cation-transporting P-type ATPase [Anaeromyxobacter sp.]
MPSPAKERPWALTTEALLGALGASPGGLSGGEAAARGAREGPNELPEPRGPSVWRELAAQVTHFMALLLWAAGGLAFASGTPELGWAIWAVVVVNGAFSFWQERRAGRALAALRRQLPHQARAWRDGALTLVPARGLVRGDVIELGLGDLVPADARLLAGDRLRVDLSLLTGESTPVSRAPAPAEPLCAVAAQAGSVVLAGATVVGGRGRALVYATAGATALGEVARLTAEVVREPSTLSVQVARLVRTVTGVAVGMGLLVFALAYWLVGFTLPEALLFAIGIVVANVPEGLLPTVTLSLALGVQRMARRRVLVRRLPAIETLSAVTVVCTDKTGTLTENHLAVRAAWTPAGPAALLAGEAAGPLRLLLAAGALCTEAATVAGPGEARAVARDPLEAALLDAARAHGLDPVALARAAPRQRELPFDPARRMMTVVVAWALPGAGVPLGAPLALVKGAPSEVLARCTAALGGGGATPLDEPGRAAAQGQAERLAALGHRVLAVAVRAAPAGLADGALEAGLTLVGLLGLDDPPRRGAAEALARCREAGLTVTVVTGDGPGTALAVAREVGLPADTRAVTGAELAALDDEALRRLLGSKAPLLFARVVPEQKLRLVRAYQALGEVVAVTGDGINDAPALRAAHVGIAMGASGTDVARGAADLVLLDDDFGSIVVAIEEGRSLFRNVRKFLTYILTSNVPELVPFLAMAALRIPPALTILQILAVDVGTDMVPALALGGEPPEPGLMQRPPRRKDAPLLDRRLLLRAYLRLGGVQALACMAAYAGVWLAHGVGLDGLRQVAPALLAHAASPEVAALQRQATSAALAAIVFCQMGNLFACRSERLSFLSVRGKNPLLALGLAVEAAVLVVVLHLPPLQEAFATAPLPWQAWPLLVLGPALLLGVDELVKWVERARLRARAVG